MIGTSMSKPTLLANKRSESNKRGDVRYKSTGHASTRSNPTRSLLNQSQNVTNNGLRLKGINNEKLNTTQQPQHFQHSNPDQPSSHKPLRTYFEADVLIPHVEDGQPLLATAVPALLYKVSIELQTSKRTKQQNLVIKAMHLDGSQDYYDILLEGRQKVQDMVRHFGFSYQRISECLRIMNNRMILLNPVFP